MKLNELDLHFVAGGVHVDVSVDQVDSINGKKSFVAKATGGPEDGPPAWTATFNLTGPLPPWSIVRELLRMGLAKWDEIEPARPL